MFTDTILFLRDGAEITASTKFGSTGEGGNLTVVNASLVELSEGSRLLTDTGGAGNAGNLEINTGQLFLRDGSAISASVGEESTGQGGNVTVTAESVELIGTSADGQFPSRIATTTVSSGKAGDIEINTSQLLIRDGAAISTATITDAPGGNLTVEADMVELIGTSADGELLSALSADTGGAGKAGDLEINTQQLIVRDGAAVSSSTLNQGQGGILRVNASDFVELRGTADNGFASGLYAQAFADGDAGNLIIETGELRIFEGARVTVAAGNAADIRVPPARLLELIPPLPDIATGNAGNLEAKADLISLNNQGQIIASTDSGEGGNIDLEAQELLLLRHNSLISAEARGTGNGGNVTIDAQFVVGVRTENSDIIANAFQGNGGRVQITTQGIYGLKFRDRLTPLSDISASSEFGLDGVVEINTPNIDPTVGLIPLPSFLEGPQLDQRCQGGRNQGSSSFVNTGRGGLPLSPQEISSNTVWEDLRPPSTDANHGSDSVSITPQESSTPTQIVEAQGWVKLPNGTIILTAHPPTATLYSSWQTPVTCPKH
ncbi:MAG: S-layer family protein [Symploca sp. SIO1A3]|nr:S-layer family protein [Symploca sp. SIO1A3]